MQPKIKLPALAGWAALCLCVLAVPRGYAQTPLDHYHAIYQEFDSTRINSPFLLDRSPNWNGVENLAPLVDTTLGTRSAWLQTYMDLYNAQFNTYPSLRLRKDVQELVKDIEEYRNQGIQPIGLLLKQFHQINEADYENTVVYDTISDRFHFNNYNYLTQSTYAFHTAPLVGHIENDLIKLLIPSEYVFNDKPIASIRIQIPQLDVDQEVGLDELIIKDIGILPEGVNTIGIKILVQVGNDTYIRNLQLIRLLPIAAPDETISNFDFPSRCGFIAPEGYSGAKAYVLYHDPAIPRLIKPIIIVEGYDPSSMDYGVINWRTFSTGKSYNEDGESVLEQLAKMPDLISRLQQEGYDVIAVDFKNIGERLEKNAATLAQIIQWVKYKTDGDENPILLGASMGGLLCQTAQNILDASGCKSCLKAFISFDSPYQGANVPLGVQELTRFFANQSVKAGHKYVYKLNPYSAKQMLYYHIHNSGEREAWKQTYARYNKNLATYTFCLSSSSDEGITYPFLDGDELLFWEVANKTTKKEYVDLHLFSKNRHNNMTFQCKVPENPKAKIPGRSIPTTTYSNFPGPNYDWAPGSMSDYIGEVLEVLIQENKNVSANLSINGPDAPKGPFHAFVPTVSAIDYYDPNPTSSLLGHNFDYPSDKTPFDWVYFPETNEFHVQITTAAIGELIAAIRSLDNTLGRTLQAGVQGNFNFNANSFNILNDLTIKPNATLNFNTFALSNYGDQPSDHYPIRQTVIGRTSSCGAFISCETGGSIVVGGIQNASNTYKAHVQIRKGSILELQSDAVLRIRDNSTLVIEEGATFIYHPGAKIYLEGPNAVLEIRGRLQLQSGAVFTFEKGNAQQNGFVRFNIPSTGNPNIFVNGNTASISLSGSGRTDKLIEIAKGSYLFLPYHPNSTAGKISLFNIQNGLVEFTDGGKIDAGCALNWSNVDLKQLTNNNGIGLYTRGQASISLDDCHFYNFSTGLYANNNDLGNPLTVDKLRFNYCTVGLESFGKNTSISDSRFWGCNTGTQLQSTGNSVINHCEFHYNKTGIQTNGSSGHVRVEAGWFLENEQGIHDHSSTPFTLECTVFELNDIGVVSMGKVNMSPTSMLYGQSLGGGNNTFHQNGVGMKFHQGEVYLLNGGNNFIHAQNSQVQNFLSGTLWSSTPAMPGFSLNVGGNYFTPVHPQGISNGSGTMYNLIGLLHILPANQTPVLLNGSLSASVNPVCFSQPRIYPMYKSEVFVETPVYERETGEMDIPGLIAYPNPTDNRIVLEMRALENGNARVEFYDMQGKKVFASDWSMTTGVNRLEINMKGILEPGIYLLKVNDGNQNHPLIKINLQH